MKSRFEWLPAPEEPDPLFESLQKLEGATVALDPFIKFKYRVQFRESNVVVSIFVTPFDDQSGADLAITNITTLPEEEKSKGHGTRALLKIIEWAKAQGYKSIKATQVQKTKEAGSFWMKNGFIYEDRPENDTNDYIYKES